MGLSAGAARATEPLLLFFPHAVWIMKNQCFQPIPRFWSQSRKRPDFSSMAAISRPRALDWNTTPRAAKICWLIFLSSLRIFQQDQSRSKEPADKR